ncbi:response regulator [Alishewanella sp. d11]|uniref:response regulator n=1 Tax=Alishewanella sp. d11 TaxID=3414030 RepID=UPI003BF8CDD7
MSQLIRFLLLAYVLGSVVFVLLLYGLQQYQAEQRMKMQLQQYAELLQVSLRPFLANNSAEQLNSLLRDLQFRANLPIAAMGLYQANGEPLASSGLQVLLPPYLASLPLKSYQLTTVGAKQVAVLPLETHLKAADHSMLTYKPDAYLVIVPEDVSYLRPFLVLMALVLGVYTLIFIMTLILLFRWQRQRNDALANLLDVAEHELYAEQTLLTLPNLPKDLQSVQQQLTQLVARFSAKLRLQEEQGAELVELQRVFSQLSQQQSLSTQEYQILQNNILLWFTQLKLIWQRQEQLPPSVFSTLMRLQLLYGQYQFTQPKLVITAIPVADWLAGHIPTLNQLLPPDVNIDWLEGPHNKSSVIEQDSSLLEAVLQALLLLARRSDSLTRLALRFRVEPSESPQLVIQLNCDGQGLSAELLQQLKAADTAQWQWRDIDLVVLQYVAKVLDAKLKIQSLEGLGLSVALQIPLSLAELPFTAKMGQVLLFDQDAERLSERTTMLNALAMQVTSSKNLTDLHYLLNKTLPDLIIIMLPAGAASPEWLALLHQMNARFNVLIFAPVSELAQWQAEISCISAADFNLMAIAKRLLSVLPAVSSKNLLVVDDNETNQAFVRVLLQHKAINLHSALSGQEVLMRCQQQQFDLILLDISLPDISGIEVARQLRTLPAYQATPILAFTAHALPAEIAEFKCAGMDDILLKPLDPDKFETLLARYQLY